MGPGADSMRSATDGGRGLSQRPITLTVTAVPGAAEAMLRLDEHAFPARIGRDGLVAAGVRKEEGDHRTPQGTFALRQVLYRPDRRAKPRTGLPVIAIGPDDLWCDDPDHVLYNRPVRAPFRAGTERLWRADRAYDVVVVLDANLVRPEPGAGSAIFFHLTKDDAAPGFTEGCVAVAPDAMEKILSALAPGATMTINET